jgi:hypothetical protein
MKKVLLALAGTAFFVMPVSAAQITNRIVDSVQLTVDGPSITSTRLGSSYSTSGSNVTATTLGGLSGGSATAAPTITTGTYEQTTDGQAFTFSETGMVGDSVVASQTSLTSGGRVDAPNVYSSSTQFQGGTAGTLAGTLTVGGVPTVTAGGAGTTAIGQRTIELSVFQ